MSKPLSAIDELAALRAEFESRTKQIRATALGELNDRIKTARAEVIRIEGEIAQLTGTPVVQPKGAHSNGNEPASKGKRLKPIEPNSEEWNKVAGRIAIVLHGHPLGLNGKELAAKLELQIPREIKRVQPVIAATTWREGAGAATRYMLNR